MVGRVRFFGGGDESLIQETARPRGRLSTGFLRGWFSLYPTTRHYPFHETDHGAPAPLHGAGYLSGSSSLASSNRISLSTGGH